MELIHSFPRPRPGVSIGEDKVAKGIVGSIFQYGLLCTPERLRIYPSPSTLNERKKMLIAEGEPEYLHPQSRFCLTLCEPKELFIPKIRGLTPGEEGPKPVAGKICSHADLFGRYAITFDPIMGRRIGFVPTIYFSPDDISVGPRAYPSPPRQRIAPGFSLQIISRLNEIRGLLVLLAFIEEGAIVENGKLVESKILEQSGFHLEYENETLERVRSLSCAERALFLSNLANDREGAAVLKSAVEIVLSLFQQTDSTEGTDLLAFFQQREWRLVHHNRENLKWFCLGQQPSFRSSIQKQREAEAEVIREMLNSNTNKSRSEEYYNHCWILESVDGEPIQSYIKSIICPALEKEEISKKMGKWNKHIPIIELEELL